MSVIFNVIPRGSESRPLVLFTKDRSIAICRRPSAFRDISTEIKGLSDFMSALNHNRQPTHKPPLTLLLAAPRGFCAGVDRAIQIVEQALQKFGAPVYVRHEIVHNRFVVDSLKAKGAVFVKELSEIPETP